MAEMYPNFCRINYKSWILDEDGAIQIRLAEAATKFAYTDVICLWVTQFVCKRLCNYLIFNEPDVVYI